MSAVCITACFLQLVCDAQEQETRIEKLQKDLAGARARADRSELRSADCQAAQKRMQELEGGASCKATLSPAACVLCHLTFAHMIVDCLALISSD